MKYLLIIAIILIGCNAEKQCQKHVRKAKEGGCLRIDSFKTIVHDTTIKEVTKKDSTTPTIEKRIIDSLRITDTCYSMARGENFKKALKMALISVKDSNYSLDIWMDKGVVKYNLHINPCVSTTIDSGVTNTIEKEVEKMPTWAYFGFAFLCLIIFGLVYWRNGK